MQRAHGCRELDVLRCCVRRIALGFVSFYRSTADSASVLRREFLASAESAEVGRYVVRTTLSAYSVVDEYVSTRGMLRFNMKPAVSNSLSDLACVRVDLHTLARR